MQNEDSTMAKLISTPKRRKKSSELNPQEPLKERGRWIEKKKKKKRKKKKKKKKKQKKQLLHSATPASSSSSSFSPFPFFFFFGLDSMESREP